MNVLKWHSELAERLRPKTWVVSLRNLLGVVHQGRCRDLPRVLDGLMHTKAMTP
jgi:hypothetical protein